MRHALCLLHNVSILYYYMVWVIPQCFSFALLPGFVYKLCDLFILLYDSIARHSFNKQKLLCVDYSPFATFSQSLAALEMELNGWSTKSKVCLLRWLDLQIFFFCYKIQQSDMIFLLSVNTCIVLNLYMVGCNVRETSFLLASFAHYLYDE